MGHLFNPDFRDFINTGKWDVFRFGRKPVVIDIMTKIKGLDFTEAFESATMVNVDDIQVTLIQYEHLIAVKKNAGRAKDINDLENL